MAGSLRGWSLFHECTTVLYEGKPVGTPDAGAFWRVMAQHGVRTFFTAPTGAGLGRPEIPRGAMPTLWHNDAGFQRTYLDAHPGIT